jgi:TPR repeat protein
MTRFLSIALLSLYVFSAQADIYSASDALSRGDYETAVTEFTKLAEKGDANAQANLGYMYYAGEGVPQDFEKAVYWYRKAATQGNRDAQYNLAVSYAFGEGTKQDLTEAAIWYRRAGEQGHVVSQYSLGISYAYGEGVPQDQKEAARWFKKAADQGYARAQVHLGSMYHTGEGVEQNYSEAVRWYRLAADRGDATAQYNLGTMYRSGKGVEQNYAQAKRWFRQSSDQGYAAATNELASLERSAAANVATRTIQTKPELPTVSETTPAPASTKKTEVIEEPVEEKVTVKESAQASQIESNDVSETKKKPLFSVEKEGLLSLDDSELDIAEPEVSVEKEIAETKATKQSTPTDTPAVTKSFTTNVSPMHNAFGIPAPNETNLSKEEAESSEGFFSKLFSKKESTEKEDVASEEVEEEPVKEITPEPKVKQDVVITPSIYPEEVKKSEFAATETVNEVEETTLNQDELALEEKESSAGFFSRLFSSKENIETEDSVSEEVVEIEENKIAEVIEEPVKETIPELEKDEEPVVTDNNWAEANQEEEAANEEEPESSGGLFSAIGNFFSGGNKTTEITELESNNENENVLIAKAEEPATATEEIKLAQKAESDLSQYSVNAGRLALTNSDYDEAYKQFYPLAEAGDSEAQSHLGSLYYVGKGVNKDLYEAYSWYKKAADQGNVDAQYSIGNMYLLGEGVEQSNRYAAKWYAMASDQGHTAAKNNLKNLEKLEALNKENQLKLDALAAEEKALAIENEENKTSVELTALDNEEKTVETNIDTETDDVEEKPGFFKRLFGSKSTENEILKETEEVLTETSSESNNDIETDESTIEPEVVNIEEQPEPVELASIEDEPEQSNSITAIDSSESTDSNSPGFFQRLFGNDEQKTSAEVDSLALDSTDETKSINAEATEPEEIIALETEVESIEEIIQEPTDTLITTTEKVEATEEKSGGLFGFLGNFFSSDKKDEATDEIALSDTEYSEITTDFENTISEEIVTEVPTLNEADRLRPLATQGDVDAQYKLGSLYYSGSGVKQDYSQAALWYRRAAQQGNVDAQYSLGNMFLMGEGIGQDDEQAAQWYTLAAEQGHSSAKHNLESLRNMQTISSPEVKSETTSTPQLISLDNDQASTTDDNSGKAIYEQALAYTFGDGVPQNDRTAFNLFYEAAEKGYVLAQYKLGVAFAYGEGVRQDDKQAAEWYRKAAEQGYTIAQRNLATMYLDGKGVEQNKVQALAWYQVVSNSGNAMDLRRRDMLKQELSEAEQTESLQLAEQLSSRITNPSL